MYGYLAQNWGLGEHRFYPSPPPFFKPHTHTLYILRRRTAIVYLPYSQLHNFFLIYGHGPTYSYSGIPLARGSFGKLDKNHMTSF